MYELIQHQEVGAGGASSITFSDIPQIYTGLYLVMSLRSTAPGDATGLFLRLNSDTSNYTSRRLYGYATSRASDTNVSHFIVNSSGSTSNSFASVGAYIPNYASSAYKSLSFDGVGETNSANVYIGLGSMLWSVTDPVTSILLDPENATANFVQYSSATLYGVGRRQGIGRAPLAMGGYMSYSNGYWYHSFPSSGSFIPFTNLATEYLVVAGGGAGAWGNGGGGGAGGYRTGSATLTAQTNYPVVVGAGATRTTTGVQQQESNGSDSSFNSLTSTGGGGGASFSNTGTTGKNGGSGGGAGGRDSGAANVGGTGNTPSQTPSQGNNGGNGTVTSTTNAGGGGGGASSPGANGVSPSTAGNGGAGAVWLNGTFYAGGGGGGSNSAARGLGGIGGGGNGGLSAAGTAGSASTGGGGGGGGDANIGANGGSGIVIVRYKA